MSKEVTYYWDNFLKNIVDDNNIWDNKNEYYKASEYCCTVYKDIEIKLYKYLNEIHETNYTVHYWKILIGPWLFHYIDQLYDKYRKVKCLLENNYEFKYTIDNMLYLTTYDFPDFNYISYAGNDNYYNIQIFSQIIIFLSLTTEKCNMSFDLNRHRKANLKSKLSESIFNYMIKMKFPSNPEIVFEGNISYSDVYSISRRSKKKIGYLNYSFNDQWKFERDDSSEERKNLSTISYEDEFQNLLVCTLPCNFPTLYLEGFSKSNELVKRSIKNKMPKVICSVGGLYNNEFSRFFTAEITQRGSKLYFAQSGGGYGTNLLIEMEDYERSISSKYFCWGWADKSTCIKLKNLPSVKLSKSINKVVDKENKSDKILFVNTSQPKFLYRFQSQPVGSQWEKYITDSLTFLDKIDDSLREKVEIRLYTNDYGWNHKQKYLEQFPLLNFDDNKKSFDERKYDVKLLVFDNITTTFLESLSANLPTVIFFDENIWEIRKEAEPYFNLLRDAKIIFKQPNDAAEFIKYIYDSIEVWWYSQQTQFAVTKFASRFALTSNTWDKDWAEELNRGD